MSEERQLTFASGGWVLLAALALVAALLAWALLGVMQGRRPIGDGTNPMTDQLRTRYETLIEEDVAR